MSTSKQKIRTQNIRNRELSERLSNLKKGYLASVQKELENHRVSISDRSTRAEVADHIKLNGDDLKPVMKMIDSKFVVLA
ncbi:MAG: hypothetical protein EON60_11995 [Alphaproteobacteria bacterium]|nr:MAG: hypothetical protein EON60_11995 [Alphaproteobacteria bacterium]